MPQPAESATATQASASEDLKAALSHFPGPAQSANHSFTCTANISSAFMWHLPVFSQSSGSLGSSALPPRQPPLAGAVTPHGVYCFLCPDAEPSHRIVGGKTSLAQRPLIRKDLQQPSCLFFLLSSELLCVCTALALPYFYSHQKRGEI